MKRILVVLVGLVLALSMGVVRPAQSAGCGALNICVMEMVVSATDVLPGPDARYVGTATGVLSADRVQQGTWSFETSTINMTPVIEAGGGGQVDTDQPIKVGSKGSGTAKVFTSSGTFTASITLVTSGNGQGVATIGVGAGVISGSQLIGSTTMTKGVPIKI